MIINDALDFFDWLEIDHPGTCAAFRARLEKKLKPAVKRIYGSSIVESWSMLQ